jgi:hypothetical protein
LRAVATDAASHRMFYHSAPFWHRPPCDQPSPGGAPHRIEEFLVTR